MNAWLTGRRGQGLAVGLTLLVLAVVWLGAAAPLQAWYADRAETLMQRQALLQRMQALAASLPALRSAASKATNGAASENMLLEGSSDAVAAADLQEMVQRMAGAAGASLAAVETLLLSDLFLVVDVAESAWNLEIEDKLVKQIESFIG